MHKSVLAAKRAANLNYRILDVDSAHVKLALYKLASAPNSVAEASYNAITLRESKAVMESLRKLDANQLEQLARICLDVVTYTVDMRILENRIRDVEQATARHTEQLNRTRWLVSNKASNQMILNLCTLITLEEIKTIRTALNVPVVKGRLKMPPLDVRSAVQHAWYDSRNETDLYTRYAGLIAQFPQLDLGQLHTIVTDSKLGGGA